MKSTESKIDIYEIDGSDIRGLKRPQVIVTNHWNYSKLVCIQIESEGESKVVTVVADELKKAIQNAQNIHSF